MGHRGTWPPQDQPQQYPPPMQQPYGQQYQPQYPPYQDQQPPWQQPPRRMRKRHTVRNVLAVIGGLLVAIIAVSVAASSGGHTVNTNGTSGGGNTVGGGHAAPKTSTARTGSAITLTGNLSGEQMDVTVVKVISDATPGDEFSSAPAGDRLYAVQFRLKDTGSAAYSDAPSNGAAVTDSAGQSYQAGIDNASGCQSFPATENIAAGSSGLGCVVFEVPKAARIVSVQFTLDSGMGPQTGQWDAAG